MSWTRADLRLDDKPVPLGNMRSLGAARILVYCGNERCGHGAALDAAWADDVTLGELQPRMLCTACGHLGADVRPLWPVDRKGYGGPHP